MDKSEIVKGYEYEKGKYAIIEPDDLKRLRIPGKDTLEITQFSSIDEVPPSLYVKPYFVVPKKGPQATAFAIVRQAMVDSDMVGLGEIAFAGREHLVALAPPPDRKQRGMMLYILRFAEEMRDSSEYFDKIPSAKLDGAQLDLAKQLIKTYTRPLELDKFTDNYEAAVRELVEAKLANKPLPKEKPEKSRGKVVDLMSALRQSLAAKEAPKASKPGKSSKPAKSKLKLVAGNATRRPKPRVLSPARRSRTDPLLLPCCSAPSLCVESRRLFLHRNARSGSGVVVAIPGKEAAPSQFCCQLQWRMACDAHRYRGTALG